MSNGKTSIVYWLKAWESASSDTSERRRMKAHAKNPHGRFALVVDDQVYVATRPQPLRLGTVVGHDCAVFCRRIRSHHLPSNGLICIELSALEDLKPGAARGERNVSRELSPSLRKAPCRPQTDIPRCSLLLFLCQAGVSHARLVWATLGRAGSSSRCSDFTRGDRT